MVSEKSASPLRKVSVVASALLLGTAVGAGGVAWAVSARPTLLSGAASAPLGLPPVVNQAGFSTLVQRVKPAVVQITTSGSRLGGKAEQDRGQQDQPEAQNLPQGPFGDMLRQYFGQQGNQNSEQGSAPEQHALGSGFIIDPAGYIATNNHVVDGARQISVTLSDGNKYPAKVIGRDPKTDLALLKVDAGKPLPFVAFGNSDDEHEGDWVVAVGNPYGLGGSVTAGIISAHGRNINEGPYDDFLQIDAPINPGNSGGPLFNQSGQVVGIDTAIYSPSGGSVGIGFAIPSNVVKNIVGQLRQHGTVARGWLGVEMQPMTAALGKAVGLPNDQGVLVNSVNAGSPASQAKLQQGDVITAFDGKPVKTTKDLAMDVANSPHGKTVRMAVWRNEHPLTLDITIGSQEKQTASADNTGPVNPPVGLALEQLSPDIRSQLKLEPSINGVVVGQVTPGSNADQSGVQAGDVIMRIAGNAVSSPREAADAIHAAQHANKSAVPLLVMRDGAQAYLGLQLAAG
jgi:serine protease Do